MAAADACTAIAALCGYCTAADFNIAAVATVTAADACAARGVNYKVGNIFSSDIFYDDAHSDMEWAKMGVLGVEMESAALYCNAARAGKKALCICTVSDSFVKEGVNMTAQARETAFTNMIEIALEIA